MAGMGRPAGPRAPPGASKGRVSDTRSSLPDICRQTDLWAGCGRGYDPRRSRHNPGPETPRKTGRPVHWPRLSPTGSGRLCTDLWIKIRRPCVVRARSALVQQVLVVGVLVDPALDERAQRHDVALPLGPYVVQRAP